MALAPSAAMMLRRGPAMGPTPTPGGAPPGAPPAGLPADPGQNPGNMLMTAIAQKVTEQKKANSDFAVGNVEQAKRVIGAMMIHLTGSHPDVARHLNRAWSSLDQAGKLLKEAAQEQGPPLGPTLGFSGASMGPQDQQMGGGGMGAGGVGRGLG